MKEEKIYNDILSNWKVPEGISKEDAWANVQAKKSKTKVFRLKRSTWIAAAAAILIFVMWLVPSESPSISVAALAETQIVQLPDNSTVTLNKGSELTRDAENWNSNRLIYLDGEAFFEVEPGESFTVITDEGQIKVLGTSFNVLARAGYLKVECYTGKVQVSKNGEQVILTPGLCAMTSKGDLQNPIEFKGTGSPAWIDGVFNFEDVPLDVVFSEVERQFGVEINHPEFRDRTYSGTFSHTDVEEALKLICAPMGLEYRENGVKRFIIQ